jgi:hypothetical protein
MKDLRTIATSILTISLFTAQFSLAISKEMHALVRMETHSNAVASRDSNFVKMENFEIPLELVESKIALRTNPLFVASMIFQREGKKFVRWIINPEDTKWNIEVERYLVENGVSTKRDHHFVGYMTASRSYIAVDPKSGAEFSIKMSTDKTGGAWRDKKQTWEDAEQIKMMTDFVDQQLKQQPRLKNIILLDEPAVFGIKGIDQAMVLRSYENLSNSGKRYVPGFSIMHENLGRDLAKANGSDDPATYWNEHYNKPLARALAEFFALTGMTYDSPHSQNFLVELDSKNHPTGKIVLRDFGDTFLSTEFFEAVNRKDILEGWEKSNLTRGFAFASVGILHGNSPPSWIQLWANDTTKNNSYQKWGQDFFEAFNAELIEQTGVSMTSSPLSRMGEYMRKFYTMSDSAGQEFINLVTQGKQRQHLMNKSCENAFAI